MNYEFIVPFVFGVLFTITLWIFCHSSPTTKIGEDEE